MHISGAGRIDVPWESNKCVLCLKEAQLTTEHIIPKSLGGNLVCRFLCQKCNSECGHKFEADAKSAATVRFAIKYLVKVHLELRDLFVSIESKQKYFSMIGRQRQIGKLNKQGFINEGRLDDGSLIVPESKATGHLERLLRKEGISEGEINKTKKTFLKTPYGKQIALSPEISIIKHKDVPNEQMLDSAPDISSLVLLKIIYEFCVLAIGECMLHDHSQLNHIRNIILQCNEQSADKMVQRQFTKEYGAFHGICFLENNPTATFQVRLFGKLVYLVSLPNLKLNLDVPVYTHLLIPNEHMFDTPDREK